MPATSTGFPSHHLWLLPTAAETRALDEPIAALAKRLGGPLFAPHVTLLGPLDGDAGGLAGATVELASRLGPLTVPVTGLCAGISYFQSVFLSLEITTDLAAGRAAALRTFGLPEGPFMPHLSLAYGGDLAARMAVVETAASMAPLTCVFDRLALVHAATEYPCDWSIEIQRKLASGSR